jgi:hypothetical protein
VRSSYARHDGFLKLVSVLILLRYNVEDNQQLSAHEETSSAHEETSSEAIQQV